MGSCGGSISSYPVNVTRAAQAVVPALESRTRVTIRAAVGNVGVVWIVTAQNGKAGQGFPLYPGEGYQLDDRGARVPVYLVGSNDAGDEAYIITEGA